MLGLWSLTGDGASFNAASAASVATDVRWKKLTGMFGQPFSLDLQLSAAPASLALAASASLCVVDLLVRCGELLLGGMRFGMLLVSYKR